MTNALSYIDFDYLILAVVVLVIFLILFICRKVFKFNIDEFIVSMFKKIVPQGKKK